MRILQLGPYPPPHGGVQRNLLAIHEFLRRNEISSSIVNITRFRHSGVEGVYFPKNWIELFILLFRLKYDIVHLHIGGSVTLRLLGLSLVCCLIPSRKAVLTFHSGGYPSSPQGQSARKWTLRGFVFRKFDRIIGVNPTIVDLFRRFGVREDRVRLISPFSIPAAPSDRPLPDFIKAFLASHSPVLVTVSLLEPEYDLMRQIEVIGHVRARHPGTGLMIIGSGNLEHDLREAIDRTPHATDILLCGDISHGETLLAIRASDLFLRTTIYDGDSISIREALYIGTPVIGTDTGMRPNGVHLVPPQDTAALDRAIEDILSRPAPARAAQGTGEENLRAVLALYEELMSRR